MTVDLRGRPMAADPRSYGLSQALYDRHYVDCPSVKGTVRKEWSTAQCPLDSADRCGRCAWPDEAVVTADDVLGAWEADPKLDLPEKDHDDLSAPTVREKVQAVAAAGPSETGGSEEREPSDKPTVSDRDEDEADRMTTGDTVDIDDFLDEADAPAEGGLDIDDLLDGLDDPSAGAADTTDGKSTNSNEPELTALQRDLFAWLDSEEA